MPRYCFTSKDGDTVVRYHPMDSIPQKCKLGDKWFYRDIRSEHIETKPLAGNYPFASTAAGVHPDQVPEIMKEDAAKGVKTEYTSEGDPIFTSHTHRRRYLKAHGLIDRSSYY